jgi:hypothetical protein
MSARPVTRNSFLRTIALASSLWALLAVPPVAAQTPGSRQFDSRTRLLEELDLAQKQNRSEEVFLLKSRLEKGDFQEGDRMIVQIRNLATPNDTMIVRSGRILQFPDFGEFSLDGVLRSELADRISQHLSKYLRDPTVRVVPLLRLAVVGRVARPAYYYAPADAILSDLMTTAGGLSQDADLNRVVIRRGTDVIWNASNVQTALADGLSLDRLHLRANDQVEVGAKRNIPWFSVIPAVTGAVLLIASLLRR